MKILSFFFQIKKKRTARPWLMNDFIFSMTAKGRKQSKYLETLHRFTSNIISTRKQYHEETGWKYLEVAENSDEKLLAIGSERKKLALIDHLIARSQNDPRITDDVIQDEVNTFVIAVFVQLMYNNGDYFIGC